MRYNRLARENHVGDEDRARIEMNSESEVVARHRAAGRTFESGGIQSFVREQGEGDPVVCMHGVPASSFLYRKVLAELAARGLRGIAFDLPGLGLAARPQPFDYSWTGLGRFAIAAVDGLALDRFHLVVHDIGGPVGFELAAAMPQRVASLTILNTIVAVDGFRRPWSMQPFAVRGLGELWLRSITKPAFRALMHLQGIGDRTAVSEQELDAYLELLKRTDGGRAFLSIMRGFERTASKQKLYEGAVRGVPYPVQVVWGADDPALKLSTQGERARRIAEVEKVHALPAKHFLQEDQAPAVADRIARLAGASAIG
jgi:pimeloyl-ACP methyl ester carboxylesterase